MGKRINRYIAHLKAERAIKAELEAKLSKDNQPKYFKWLLTNRKKEIALTLVGLICCVVLPPVLLNPDNNVPTIVTIGSIITIFGFTAGMALLPYKIYRGMVRINYWSPNFKNSKTKQ